MTLTEARRGMSTSVRLHRNKFLLRQSMAPQSKLTHITFFSPHSVPWIAGLGS